MSNFDLYSQYYDLVYKEKDTVGECKYVVDRLDSFGVSGNNWLELGAGSGRHGRHFKDQGIQWQGVERSENMVAQAKQKGLHIQEGAIQNFQLQNQSFDAILALFHVISYLTDNEDLNATFQNVSHHLKPGGLFLFDIWYSPAVYHLKPEKRIKRIEDNELEIIRHASPEVLWNENRVNVYYDIEVKPKNDSKPFKFEELHPMRHFSLPELKLLADFHHFDWLHAEEWITKKLPSTNTWGVCCILKKRS